MRDALSRSGRIGCPKVSRSSAPSVTRSARALLLLAIFVWPAVAPARGQKQAAFQRKRTFQFEKAGVRFSNRFPGARLNECTQVGKDAFRLVIRPENSPINNSAWYAFRVTSAAPKTITATLTYVGGTHRYQPRISRNGRDWRSLAADRCVSDKSKRTVTLRLDVDKRPLWVAARDLIGIAQIEAWVAVQARKSFVRQHTIGKSMRGRPIRMMTIGKSASRNLVFVISRQHPPEVSGTFGLMTFVETLSSDSPLARRYRERFLTLVVPLVNPDGLDAGHWRHNMGGADLNRDWKDFKQPETRQVRDALLRYAARPKARPFLFLDFHSTRRDIFYTQKDRHPTFPPNFTRDWLAALGKRFPEYQIRRSGAHNPTTGTSKGWFYERFKIPSITYEFGDHTERKLIRRITGGSTEEMMRLLLAAAEN